MVLIWALWLVICLIKWLKWGWGCFIEGGIWKKRKPKTPLPLDTADQKADGEKV